MSSKSPTEPERLLGLALSGDGDARSRLLEQYRSYLGLLARHQIGRQLQGKFSASDLVQETFLEAHRDFAQFRGHTEAELLAWLRRILATNMANLVQRYQGTKRRNVRLERELVDALDETSGAMAKSLAAPLSSPSHQAARREQAVLLADALERLPADYREVLVLRHVEGLTFPVIARRLHRSLDSVKNLWARGLARLRRTLGGAP
jgi:RNA polymerase sigma-70 factor (ECF subfamily)